MALIIANCDLPPFIISESCLKLYLFGSVSSFNLHENAENNLENGGYQRRLPKWTQYKNVVV